MLFSVSLGTAPASQTGSGAAGEKDNLQMYTACQFGDKTRIEEAVEQALPFLRPVDTTAGRNTVEVLHGFSLHIAYDDTPFINFKAERLGKATYARDKQILIDSLANSAANTPDMESPKPKQSSLNGFELYSINRKQLAGGVLGIYLLFRDSDRTVVTLYFLNTPPENPKFSTTEQAHGLRDASLNAFTGCVSKKLAQ